MGKNRGDKLPSNNIFPEVLLSPLELRVAQLQRSGLGRNGISAALGISENSVKTVLSRIARKLGGNWVHNPVIKWRDEHNGYMSGERGNYLAKELQTWPNPMDEKMAARVYKNRVFSNFMLIVQSKGDSRLLKVSGAQRFWLKPALTALNEWRYIKLLGVDWSDEFGPPWLPMVNRGRRVIRAANYNIIKHQKVTTVLENYIRYEIQDYIIDVFRQIESICQMVGAKNKNYAYPSWVDFTGAVQRELGGKIECLPTSIQLENDFTKLV